MTHTIQGKEKIKHALISLMLDRSFESITITDISKKAKINRSTYYYYYYQKEEILEDIITQCIDNLIHQIKAPYSKTSEIEINKQTLPSSLNLFEHVYKHKYEYKVLLNSEAALSFQNQLVEILISHFLNETNSSYANHSSNDFIDQAINAGYCAYGILGMIKEWGKNDYCQSPEYMAKQLTYVLFYKVEKVELKYNKQD